MWSSAVVPWGEVGQILVDEKFSHSSKMPIQKDPRFLVDQIYLEDQGKLIYLIPLISLM